jgi:HK97 family phage major capsid protein
MGINGALPNYDTFLKAITTIKTANWQGDTSQLTALMSPRTWGYLARLKNGDGETLTPPADFAAMKKLTTTQILNTNSKGSSGAVASELYIGDFSQMLVGMRTDLKIEISRKAGDSTGSASANFQVWVRSYLRCDMILSQPTFFVYADGVLDA